jgi:hypothetical protein
MPEVLFYSRTNENKLYKQGISKVIWFLVEILPKKKNRNILTIFEEEITKK